MNLPKLCTLVVVLVLATGGVVRWYVVGTDAVRAERLVVELEIARLGPLPVGGVCIDPATIPARSTRPAETRERTRGRVEGRTITDLRECPFVPGCDRV